MKKQSKYINLAKQNITRKIVSSFLDVLFLVFINVILVLTIVFPILKSNEEFKRNNDNCFSEIHQIYIIQEEAKVNYLVDGSKTELIEKEELFKKYINQQIVNSYIHNIELFNEHNITLEVEAYEGFSNDELSYYFVNYKVEKKINLEDFNKKDPKVYYVEDVLFKNINKDYYDVLADDYPIIKFEKALNLYQYINNITSDKSLYNEFMTAYSNINQIAVNDLTNYSEYEKHYNNYLEAFSKMSEMENIALTIVYIITFILFILLPQLLSKEGVTLGRLLTKTRVCKLSGEEVNVKDILISNVFTFITFAIVIVISSLFTFGLTNLTVSILTIGEFTLTYLQLLMLSILMIFIHLAFICFNYDHFTFSEFISKTQSKDLTYYIKEEK